MLVEHELKKKLVRTFEIVALFIFQKKLGNDIEARKLGGESSQNTGPGRGRYSSADGPPVCAGACL